MTVKISALPAAGSVAGTDEFETNQSGTSRKATAAQIRAGLATSGAVGSSGLTMNTARLLGRTTASSGAVEEITVGTGLTLSSGSLTANTATGTLLNVQVFTSSGTYTRSSGVSRAVVIAVGGGGGGGRGSVGSANSSVGGTGGTTSFGSHVTAIGGSGGTSTGNSSIGRSGLGGSGGTGATIAVRGAPGDPQTAGYGGSGGGQGGGTSGSTAGVRGGGGAGGDGNPCASGGGGGGQGETCVKYITSGLGSTETVTIGAGGTAAGGTGNIGGAGGAGYIIVYEYA